MKGFEDRDGGNMRPGALRADTLSNSELRQRARLPAAYAAYKDASTELDGGESLWYGDWREIERFANTLEKLARESKQLRVDKDVNERADLLRKAEGLRSMADAMNTLEVLGYCPGFEYKKPDEQSWGSAVKKKGRPKKKLPDEEAALPEEAMRYLEKNAPHLQEAAAGIVEGARALDALTQTWFRPFGPKEKDNRHSEHARLQNEFGTRPTYQDLKNYLPKIWDALQESQLAINAGYTVQGVGKKGASAALV